MFFSWKPFPEVEGQQSAAQSDGLPICLQLNAATKPPASGRKGQSSMTTKCRTRVTRRLRDIATLRSEL